MIEIDTRWSDFDANRHLIHTAYAEFCSIARVKYLGSNGLSFGELNRDYHIGPILFSEYCQYRREIRMEDSVQIDIRLFGISAQAERWKIRHYILKNGDEIAATHEVYGAWMNVVERKLTAPPKFAQTIFKNILTDDDFQVIEIGSS